MVSINRKSCSHTLVIRDVQSKMRKEEVGSCLWAKTRNYKEFREWEEEELKEILHMLGGGGCSHFGGQPGNISTFTPCNPEIS